ncbi:MAG: heterodisulfide reductase-related iron-sulfur binding cluster [Anaerolineae bacterium]
MEAGLDKVDAIWEKETAIVEGMDISGPWNRMFEQRVIWEYTPELIEQVADLPEAESFAWCYQCAKCVPVCPVDVVGDYGPRKLYRKAQTGVNLLGSPDLWLCTTCMNCLRVCPKEVDMIKIMPAAREHVLLSGNGVPAELQDALENTFRYGNPLGQPARKRDRWVKKAGVPVPLLYKEKQPVEWLWWVECYPSYHPRGIDASHALAHIFNALGLDFGILGREEKCVSDSQRLAGEGGLFEALAEENIATLSKYEFRRIVVTDPHALNAFRKEYPKHGGDYEVWHYTQLLAQHLDRLRELMTQPLAHKVTFHDPCYLGRHNGEYDAPRQLIQALPGVEFVEMWRCRENGYCCGGGGGGMWLDGFAVNHQSRRLSEQRVLEAVATGADTLVVCCPYEVSRFEDAVKSTGNESRLLVRDIAELIAEAMR